MKNVILYLALAILVSCAINSLLTSFGILPQYSAVPIPAGQGGPVVGIHTVKKQEMAMPEVQVVDEPSEAGYATDVVDTKLPTSVQYPLNGNF